MVDQTLPPIAITAQDQTGEAWDSVKRNARATGDALDQLKSRLEQGLGGGDGGAFGKIGKLSDAFGRLKGAVGTGGLLIGGTLVAAGVAATLAHNKLSELGQAAEDTGRKASEIDNLARQLERVGGKSGDAASAVKGLRKAIDEAAEGEGEQVKDLNELFDENKVKLTDAAGKVKSLGAIYQDVSKLIVNAANDTDRLVIATIAFGEEAARPMVKAILDGADNLEKMGKAGDAALDDLTKKAREFDAMLKTLTGSADGFGRRLGDSLKSYALPAMQFIYERGTEIGALLGSKSAQFNLSILNTRRAGYQVEPTMRNQRDIDDFYNAVYGKEGATKVKKPKEPEADPLDKTLMSIGKHIALMKADADAVGATAGEHERLRVEAQLLEAAQQKGIPVIGETAKKFDELKARAREAADALAFAKLKSDIFFDRAQLGRTETEQKVAQQLRSAAIDPASEHGKFLADQIRLNSALTETKDIAKDALKPLIDDLAHGTLNAQSFAGALDRIRTKLSDKLLDAGLSVLIKGVTGWLGGSASVADPTFGGFSAAGTNAAAVKFHLGGIVGLGGTPINVPAHVFANARRYHSGGLIGPDEVPIIAQKGERVLRRGESAGGGRTEIHIHQNFGGVAGEEAMARVAYQHTQRALTQVPGIVAKVNGESWRGAPG